MIKSYSGILTVIFCFLFNLSQGATYYNRTGSTSPTATASWTTSATGGAGTSPGSFTASGDIFIIRSGTTMTQGQADWTIGSGVTLDIRGTLKIGNGSTYCCGVLCLSTCYAYYGLVMNTNAYLYVRNGGVLEIVNDYLDGCTFQFPSVARTTFEPTSTMLFTDGAGKFNPSYTYGHLTFNDNTGSPPVLTSALNVQSDLTVANVNANWIMSTTGSLTHNIGGSFIFTAPDNDIIVFDNGTGAPVYNIGGDFRFDAPCAGSIRFNNGASGTPVLNLTGSLTMNATGDFDANGSPDASFAGTSWTGNATLNIGGNVNANTYGAIHFSNEYGCTTAGCTTIGATTAYISGSIIVSSSGHVDLGYNILGGANMIYVSGSATVAAGGILVGPHGMGKTDGLVPTLIFRSPASGIATGNLSMTTGDMEGAAANCNSGSGQFNVVIQANRIITLLSDIDLGNNRTFTVNAGGTLNTGTAGGTAYTIRRRLNDGTTYATGTTFTLSATSGGLYSEIQANATPNALMASAYSGNIQTNTRVYSPSANYRFNATGAQSTGDFMTSASNGGRVNKLIVNNTSGTITTGLTLSNALTITSDLTFVAGRLKTTTTNLPTIDVSGTSSGYAFSTANTAYVDGPVAKNSNSTTEFNLPTGSSAANLFRPIAYSPASSSATTYQVQLYGGYMGGVLLTLLNWVCPVFYWDSRYISGSAIANVKLYYVSSDLSTAPVPGSHYYATTTQFNFNGLLQWVNMGSSGSDSLS
jgi:hypothetical protein